MLLNSVRFASPVRLSSSARRDAASPLRFSSVASPSGALTTYHVEIFAGLIGVGFFGALLAYLLFERQTDRVRRALRGGRGAGMRR